MGRAERVLLNKKQNYFSDVKDGDVTGDAIQEGSFQLRYINGVLYIVAKKNNKIWYFKGSQTK